MAVEFNFDVDLEALKLTAVERRVIEQNGVGTIFEGLLTGLLNQKFPEGLKGSERKSFNRILRKLDESESVSIELESAEVDLLKSVFNEETAVPPQSVRLFSAFEAKVEAVAKEVE